MDNYTRGYLSGYLSKQAACGTTHKPKKKKKKKKAYMSKQANALTDRISKSISGIPSVTLSEKLKRGGLGALLGGGLGAGVGLAGVGLKDVLEGDKGEDDTGLGSYALGGLGGGALGALGGGAYGVYEGHKHDKKNELLEKVKKHKGLADLWRQKARENAHSPAELMFNSSAGDEEVEANYTQSEADKIKAPNVLDVGHLKRLLGR